MVNELSRAKKRQFELIPTEKMTTWNSLFDYKYRRQQYSVNPVFGLKTKQKTAEWNVFPTKEENSLFLLRYIYILPTLYNMASTVL